MQSPPVISEPSRLNAWSVAADILDPPDVFGKLGYIPNPKQRIFHNAGEYDVLYGGAAGGGKAGPW